MSDRQPQPGDVLLGSFRLRRQLGAGSFARVYLAEQLGMDRLAVVKIPHAHLLDGELGPEIRRRFNAEAKAGARVSHRHIVTVYMIGEAWNGTPALAMEYVPGESLRDRLRRSAPLELSELAQLGTQLGEALEVLHQNGIVHRDISPSNVLLSEQGEAELCVKLLDFGVAKLLDDGRSRTYGPMGTPGYLAPEQLLGQVTPRSDLYSLGAVLWWALTGAERPDDFNDGSLEASLGRTVGPDPRSLRADAPPVIAELIARTLTPEPSHRPTIAEFLTAWRAATAQAASHSEAAPVVELHPPRPRAQTPLSVGARPDPRAQTEFAVSVELDTPRPKVAVVLPNPVTRTLVRSYLEQHTDVEIELAEAREVSRATPGSFAALILDEQLEEVDAAAFIEHMQRCHEDLPVLAVGRQRRLDASIAERRERLGVEVLIGLPDQLPTLGPALEAQIIRRSKSVSVEPRPHLRPSLVSELIRTAPREYAASLETFIGCVPQWIAQLELGIEAGGGHEVRESCGQLINGAASVGAEELARLARATCEFLRDGDLANATDFLAAAEREYQDVFKEAFAMIQSIQQPKEGTYA